MKKLNILAATLLLSVSTICAQTSCCKSANCTKPDYDKFGYFYKQRATLFDRLPVNSDAIVMLGNSITNGCEWHELLGNPKVINRGISGDIVEGVQTRLASVLAGKPAKIFLMIGVNDVSHDLSADSIAGSIGDLVHRIRTQSPSTRLYLQSCLPINQSFGCYHRLDGKEQVVRDINTRLSEIAAREGATWIDLYPLLADENGNLNPAYTNDGLHLIGPGYLVWRDAIMPYVNE